MEAQRCTASKQSQYSNSGLLISLLHPAPPKGKARWERHGILLYGKEVIRQRHGKGVSGRGKGMEFVRKHGGR